MGIEIINNRIYFNDDNKAFANALIDATNSYAYIELLKVVPEYRQQHLASKLMRILLSYIKNMSIQQIELNPIPLDTTGLKLNELISFYSKLGFIKSVNQSEYRPNLMSLTYKI